MEWSPQDAMKAYLQTLHLCKAKTLDKCQDTHCNSDNNRSKEDEIIEPQGLELVSALAAGNRARVLVEITTSQQQAISPLTLALAVAAKQTGGKLICIVPSHDHLTLGLRKIKEQLSFYGLDGLNVHPHQDVVVEVRVGDPYEQIRDLRNIDFIVINCRFDHNRLRSLCETLHTNPKGAIIVANNILSRTQSVALIDQLLKGKRGLESSITTVPLGLAGVQVIIRIKPIMAKPPHPQRRRHKRFLVTFDG